MKLKQLVRPALRVLVLLAITAVAGAAETAHLVLDINTFEDPYDGGSLNPNELAPVGERIVFTAYDHLDELWASDGTVNGTELLLSSGAELLGTTGKLTFWGGEQLWRSDGTSAGTFPLGTFSSSSAILGELLFFMRSSGESQGIWQTDGTLAGTREVAQIPARWLITAGARVFAVTPDEVWRIDRGKAPVFVERVSGIQRVMTAGDRLLMLVGDFAREELWASDGTAAGTRPVTSFTNTFPFSHSSGVFLSRGKHLYFTAYENEHGEEIWRSDGTPAGTRRITDFRFDHPFQKRYLDITLQEVEDRVVFAAGDSLDDAEFSQIWATDGRPESTTKLMNHPCPADGYGCMGDGSSHFHMVRAGSLVLFPAKNDDHGLELWATDGTPRGTRLLKDLCSGSGGSVPLFTPASPQSAEIYFSAYDGTGLHLWRTDGTAAGTRKLTRTAVYYGDFIKPQIAVAGDKVFMKAGDQFGGSLRILQEGELRPLTFPTWRHYGSNPQGFSVQGDRLFFSVEDGFDWRLWQTRGTAETTRPDPAVEELSEAALLSAGGVVYHIGGNTLSKLTEDGLQLIAPLSDGTGSSNPTAAALGHLLYFPVIRDGAWEIWRTDGTPAGTGRIVGLPAEVRSVGIMSTSVDRLYFTVSAETGNGRLWTSDGTSAGTRELIELPGYQRFTYFDGPSGTPFTRAGNLDYFVTYFEDLDGDSYLLWRTDGTPAGTRQVQLSSDLVVLEPGEKIGHAGALYLLGRKTSDSTSMLWRIDGDTAVRLRSFGQRPQYALLSLAEAGGRVLFTMHDDEHGTEVWTTDGTAGGTRVLREIGAARLSAQAAELTSAGGRAFFTAWDEDHGIELWQTDGTEAGTELVHDLAPGPASSRPRELTVMGDQLYFSADDGLTGRELWALPLAGSAGCTPSTRVLCLQGGRYRVEVSWRDFQKNSGKGTAVSLTPDTGYFWFFDPANAELIVKVLDGQSLNGHVWVFYGALSNVEYVLTVTDMQTGFARRYMNPAGNLASVGDTHGFGPLGAHSATPEPLVALPSPPALVSGRTVPAAATGNCQSGPQRLCLNGGRFAVEASWKDFQGHTGAGTAVSLSADTGYFWFFDQANVEVLLKVLDGTPLNGKFWVFYGALSNVEYTLKVTDTQTGAVKEYKNPSGRFASVADTGAF